MVETANNMRRRVKLPQISRLFSASAFRATLFWTGKLALWAVLVALFSVNAIALSHKTLPIAAEFIQILENPFNVTSHVQSALHLHNLGLNQAATQELVLAQDLKNTTPGSVLGATTDPATILESWAVHPQKLQEQYEYWKGVIAQKPDYRDGLVVEGLLAYELGKTGEAKTLLTKAQQFDPNDGAIVDLLRQISEK